MSLISESYKQQNKQLHEVGNYGISGHMHAKKVLSIARKLLTKDILDYGCGQKTLEKALGFDIQNYDPAIEGCDTPPKPAQLVICGDVLEHIEPEYIDAVLDDLKRLTLSTIFLVISIYPAEKTLPDGRNAHLILESDLWWLDKIMSRFKIVEYANIEPNLYFICEAL